MSLKIRLQRHGSKNNPAYRVVVAESSARRDGRFVEILGHYNPIAKGKEVRANIDVARADYWVSKGAQPTDTAAHLLRESRKRAAASVE
jgi:small subunit ribosomal protein S16